MTFPDHGMDSLLRQAAQDLALPDVDRLVAEGDTVVAIGSGRAALADGGEHHFAFCDVFTFRSDLIARVESFVVELAARAVP